MDRLYHSDSLAAVSGHIVLEHAVAWKSPRMFPGQLMRGLETAHRGRAVIQAALPLPGITIHRT